MYIYIYICTYVYIYIYIYIYITFVLIPRRRGLPAGRAGDATCGGDTPGSHSKISRHNIFAKGWVAQNIYLIGT